MEKLQNKDRLLLKDGRDFFPEEIHIKGKRIDRNTSFDLFEKLFNSLESCNPRDRTFEVVGYSCGKLLKVKNTFLAKCHDFGGRPTGYYLKKENLVLKSLQRQLKRLGEVELYGYKGIVDVQSTEGQPKSDFHFLNKDGEPVIFVSHKAGKTPGSFQQYSGVDALTDHPESLNFIEDMMSCKFFEGAVALRRKIKCDDLKRASVYGEDFDKEFGYNNVNLLVQGNIKIKDGELEAHKIDLNPEIPSGEYEPFFYATYRKGRNDKGVKDCRLGIYTKEFRKNKEDV